MQHNRLRRGPLLLSVVSLAVMVGMTGCRGDEAGNQAANAPITDPTPGVVTDVEVPDQAVLVRAEENPHAYTPRDISVAPGQPITWSNPTDDRHTVTTDNAQGDNGPNSDASFPNGIPKGDTWTFMVPSDTPIGKRWYYHCRFHGKPGDGTTYGTGMVGSILVVDPRTTPTTPSIGEKTGGGPVKTTGTTGETTGRVAETTTGTTTGTTPTRLPSGKPITPPIPTPSTPQTTPPTVTDPNSSIAPTTRQPMPPPIAGGVPGQPAAPKTSAPGMPPP
ncbi:MAG: hypothetical protein KY468_20920 [Armatimonadetes bacterium]|nr:hypothetical protein [Armatimonadota bacterium]